MLNIHAIRKIVRAVLILCFAALIPFNSAAEEGEKTTTVPKTRLAVIPFMALEPESSTSTTVQCPLCGHVNSGGPVFQGAQATLEEIFISKLRESKNVEIIAPERAAGVYRRISSASLKESMLEVVRQTGRELSADVVLAGFVYRCRERVGYSYSAKTPASLSFEVHLISVKDGSSLWRGVFDRTQKSLMEDLFLASSFFKGGAKWVTARELTRLGVDEVFETFPVFDN
jgi:TolB-like protein